MRALMIVIPLLLIPTGSVAAAKNEASSQLLSDVQKCRSVADNAGRLSCYDRSVNALVAATVRGEIKVIDRQTIREARKSLFGFGVAKIPFFSGNKDGVPEQKEVVSTLTSFRELGNGFYRFNIADPESSWETTEASFIDDGRPGAKVTIQRGGLGSYFAQIGKSNWVRARRSR